VPQFVLSSSKIRIFCHTGRGEEGPVSGDTVSITETLCIMDNSPGRIRINLNQRKTEKTFLGPHGSVEEGLDKMSPKGTLYSFDRNLQLKSHVDKIPLSNGLVFNNQAKKMYYADTLTGIIDQFDFDVTNGAICKLIAVKRCEGN
jgi:sugar lactone lactonase YvrE